VVHPLCCGLDVHAASLVAGLHRVSADGPITLERREFGTTYGALLTLSAWFVATRGPSVALESPGVDWNPVSHVLSGVVAGRVGHPQEIRQRPGKKTDSADATWSAALLAPGLIQPSLMPPPPIRALRDLTRPRVALVQSRPQATSRGHKMLEDTHSKLATGVSDLCGRSGRRMLAALSAGERAPRPLAALALGRLRRQQPALALALTGPCTPHHAWLIAGALELGALRERHMAELD
jgi:transposase